MVSALRIPKRIIDVSVGLPSGAARSFRELDQKIEAHSWARSKPNEGKATIYNCSRDTIRYLESPGLVLTINAGLDIPGQLFQGAISRDGVSTKNQGPTWVTTIEAADGRRAYRDAVFSRSYPPGTALETILKDVGIAMGKPITVAATIPPAFRAFVAPTGWTFHTKARSALDEMLLPWGLTWSIISGALYIVDPLKPLPGNAPLITPQSGLHGTAKRTKRGAKFKADLNPAIIAGRASVLQSDMLSGTYRNEDVFHAAEDRRPLWETKVQGTKI